MGLVPTAVPQALVIPVDSSSMQISQHMNASAMPMAFAGTMLRVCQHAERTMPCALQMPRAQRRAAERRAAKASRLSCKAALQFDTKVFQAEKVDLAGTTEYLYRGGRDQFQKLGKVSWHAHHRSPGLCIR